MKMNRQRKSPRLQGYDYSQPGGYFVTICTHQRQHLFGEIQADEMILNGCGEIAAARWLALPKHHSNCEIDAFVVMPNHVHGILIITDNADTDNADTDNAGVVPTEYPSPQAKGGKSGLLSTIIGSYKSGVTRRIREFLRQPDLTVWLQRIREYVLYNPSLWQDDVFYHPSHLPQ